MSSLDQTVAAPPPSFWSSVREALRGSHQDFTAGNLNRAIIPSPFPWFWKWCWSRCLPSWTFFWVGRLGADAVATVGLTESLLSLVFAVGLGLSLSTTAMVARRIGEKDPKAAAVAGVQAIAIGLAVSLLVGIPCLIFAPDLLRLMGASPQIVQVGSGYARIALGGSGAILLLFLNNAIFRGAGDAAIAMRLLWVSNIINLVLDPALSSASARFQNSALPAQHSPRSLAAASACFTSSTACSAVRSASASSASKFISIFLFSSACCVSL